MRDIKQGNEGFVKQRIRKIARDGLKIWCVLLLVTTTVLFGCDTGVNSPQATNDSANSAATEAESSEEVVFVESSGDVVIESDASVMNSYDWSFTTRDVEGSYDASGATVVTLSDDGGTQIEGAGASMEDSLLSITEAGVYLLSGTLSDGSILIDVPGENDKVQLVLDGVEINSSTGAAILVENADKVFITLAEGSVNTLSDGATHEVGTDENDHDGVIFSHDDLTLNGGGTLVIEGNYDNGIVGKNDVRITSGTYKISVLGHGIQGKDCVKILDGTFDITSGADAVHASNDEDDRAGYMGVAGGTFTISAGDDAFHADAALLIAGGEIDVLNSYEGFEGRTVSITGGNSSLIASDDGINAAIGSEMNDDQGFGGSGFDDGDPGEGGRPDAMPEGTPPDQMTPPVDEEAGAASLATTASQEEATQGVVADGQAEASQSAVSSSDCFLEITGGYIYIKAGGDCLDSNGAIIMSGGEVLAECTSNGADSTIDSESGSTITGGILASVGPTGMAQGFSASSTQPSILLSLQSAVAEGAMISIQDSSGAEVYSYEVSVANQSIVVSTPDLKEGETYTIFVDGESKGETTAALETAGGMGGPGGMRSPDERGGRGFSTQESA